MQWSKGALIGVVPSTCIGTKRTCEVADWSCQWQALKVSGTFCAW